ncbi:ribonuclease Z [Candidatus Bipolaricaulota bacterium]|nr:ribonuclease Z [Candidatus Bipolaricaulota bacterium]
MNPLSLTCLGSGSALGGERLWSSLLIDDTTLLGLPPTAIPQLHRLHKDLTKIRRVFISHLHADHSFGLPFLLLHYRYTDNRPEPLYIIGPSGLKAVMKQLCRLAWPGLCDRGFPIQEPVRFIEVAEDGSYDAGGFAFDAVRMAHYNMLSFGFRFKVRGRLIAFTGDTGRCDAVLQLIDGADVVITEFTHTAKDVGENGGHFDASDIHWLLEHLPPETRVLATHMSGTPSPQDRKLDRILFCEDGAQIEL